MRGGNALSAMPDPSINVAGQGKNDPAVFTAGSGKGLVSHMA
jgi:hypothetical protein